MMMRKLIMLSIAFAMLGAASALAQGRSGALEREVKAAFLFKFGGYVEWQSSAFPTPDAPFTIGVVGDDALARDCRPAAGLGQGRGPERTADPFGDGGMEEIERARAFRHPRTLPLGAKRGTTEPGLRQTPATRFFSLVVRGSIKDWAATTRGGRRFRRQRDITKRPFERPAEDCTR